MTATNELIEAGFRSPPPAWLQAKCDEWQERLMMQHCRIELVVGLFATSADPDAKAATEHQSRTEWGRITVKNDIQDDEDGEVTIVHELLHIKHSQIDDLVFMVFGPGVSASGHMVEAAFADAYHLIMEPFIESMARVLVKMHRAA